MKAVTNTRMILEDRILEEHILLYNERIEAIVPNSQISDLSGVELTDGGGGYLSPGLIDIHIHGLAGVDTMDGTREALGTMAGVIGAQGVTAFVPTTMTAEPSAIDRAVSAVRQWRQEPGEGAEILGVHLEGPFISREFKGAQNPAFIKAPDYSLAAPWLDMARIITLAPEAEGAEAFIRRVLETSSVILSIGHSDADLKQALSAYKAGVRHITHCFNAMKPLHHRAPGVVGAALGWPFTTEIICDDVHVDPSFYQGFLNIKGLDRVVLVTDCMQAGGLPDGSYTLGGQAVHVKGGACRLTDGTLAGSTLQLNQALRNVKRTTDLNMPQLVGLASRNPAAVLGILDQRGTIEAGKLADFFLHDEDYNVARTVGRGTVIFENKAGIE